MDDLVGAVRRTVERRAELPCGVVPILVGESRKYAYETLPKAFGRLLRAARRDRAEPLNGQPPAEAAQTRGGVIVRLGTIANVATKSAVIIALWDAGPGGPPARASTQPWPSIHP